MRILRVRRKWIIRLVIALLVVAVSMFWALRYPESVKNLYRIFPSFSLPKEGRWTLEVHTIFSRCGHTLDVNTEYASEKELNQIVEANPKYKVEHRQTYRMVCLEQKDKWCVSCNENYFLGIENHHVAVIRGTPGQPGPVAEMTPIDTQLLPEVERSDLKTGIPFRGEKEKLQLLEGLNGLIVN